MGYAMKLVDWIQAKLPWATKRHYHGDPTLLKYGVCSKCGHLILNGHVNNQVVSIRAWGMTWGATYAKQCAPCFDHLELAPDRTVHAYNDKVEVLEIPEKDAGEFERLSQSMLAEVAHLERPL